jgi:ribosome-associated heat shock protein Hsp15
MAAGEQRIDKWLFFARVVKSRSLAQKLAVSGAVRVNREKISHAARLVRPGDVLTISIHDRIRILKILDSGDRRGPAPEAALLFQDLTSARADAEPAVSQDEG